MRCSTIFRFLLAISCLMAEIGTVRAQELQPVLSAASSRAIVAGCEAYALEHKLLIAIAVMGPGKILVAFQRLDGAIYGAGEIAIWKAGSSAALGISSKEFGAMAESNPQIALAPSIATLEGGEPIYTHEGFLLGGVGVSGASAVQDSACARAGIRHARLKSKKSE